MTSLGVEWLGQSGFLLHFSHGATVCIDPYLSHAMAGGKTRERLLPIPLAPWQLGADVVITTHDHIDHFDEITLRPLAEIPDMIFAGPSSCRNHWLAMGLPAERFLRLDRGDALEVAGVRLAARHAQHRSGALEDAIGVVLEAGGFRVYHVGDSEYVPALVAGAGELRPDLLLVPINGRGGNMDYTQAAQLTDVVQPRAVIPMHYGMFASNAAYPQDFVDACRASGVEARIAIMKVGVRFDLDPAPGS